MGGSPSSQQVEENIDNATVHDGAKKRIRIDRFISDPQMFRGTTTRGQTLVTEARLWLEKMNNLMDSTDWSDVEMLYVAGDHLTDRARRWWALKSKDIKTWEQFQAAFKEQFLSDLSTNYWKTLQEMRHEDYDSVDEMAIHMEEMFDLIHLNDDAFRLRIFLGALKPAIGYEVEKDPVPETFMDAKVKARKAERTFSKYHIDTGVVYSVAAQGAKVNDNIPPTELKSVSETMMAITDKLERIQVSLAGLERNKNAYRNMDKDANNHRTGIVCFSCGEPGHKSFQCDKKKQGGFTGNNYTPGLNSNPQTSGKGQEQQ